MIHFWGALTGIFDHVHVDVINYLVPFFPVLKVANKTSNCFRYCEEGDKRFVSHFLCLNFDMESGQHSRLKLGKTGSWKVFK